MASTEPDAGSDVASIATTATKDGDYYVLRGKQSLYYKLHYKRFPCGCVCYYPGSQAKTRTSGCGYC